MGRAVGVQAGGAGVLGTSGLDEVFPGTDDRHVLQEALGALPMIEISDKDYRSFCWPCYALEETGHCQ